MAPADAPCGFGRPCRDLLSGTVEFDRPRLGDIAGREVVHLQCHLGNDSLSLARLGATVTGGEWQLRDAPERLPATYTLRARTA